MSDVFDGLVGYAGDWFDKRGYELRFDSRCLLYEVTGGVRKAVIGFDLFDSVLMVSFTPDLKSNVAFFVAMDEPDAFEALDEVLNEFMLRKLV